MLVTTKDIEKLIQDAKAAGADPAEIEDLEDHLSEINSGKLMFIPDSAFRYQKIDKDGTKVICFSTAPVSPDDDDDFEGVSFKSVKPPFAPN